MQVKDRQKICAHCDGRIAVEADTCIYCGMPLLAEKPVETRTPTPDILASLQGGAPSLYPPLYSQKGDLGKKELYENTSFNSVPRANPSAQDAVGTIGAVQESSEDKAGVFSVVLTLLGSNLFILGLMQGFFSDKGFLRLEWNCRYWVLYLLLAMPLVYFGLKKSKTAS